MCSIDFVAPVIRFAVLRGPSVTTDTVASVECSADAAALGIAISVATSLESIFIEKIC